MLDALVYRKNREVAGPAQSTVIQGGLKVTQNRNRPIAIPPHPIHKIRPRKVQSLLVDRLAGVAQQSFGFRPKELFDFAEFHEIPESLFSSPGSIPASLVGLAPKRHPLTLKGMVRWLAQVILGLLLNGTGLSLLGWAAHQKFVAGGEWFWTGTLSLVLCNAGVCCVVGAKKP